MGEACAGLRQTPPLAALLLSLLLTGCATVLGSEVYSVESWSPTRAELDWDLDLVVCDEKAQKRELSQEEEALIAQQQATMRDAMSSPNSEATTLGELVSFVGHLFVSSMRSQERVQVKRREFLACMYERGWEYNDFKDLEEEDLEAELAN